MIAFGVGAFGEAVGTTQFQLLRFAIGKLMLDVGYVGRLLLRNDAFSRTK
jgi:hypothetical protein